MTQTKWFERKFDFSFQQNILPEIIERLSATAENLEEIVKSIATKKLELKLNNTWSVKENIGHLSDLEPLWLGRLEDILTGKEFLRPTDLENKKTDLALHNQKDITELLSEFAALRNNILGQLSKLDESDIYKAALHPRLKTPMRIIDLFLFVAEHDDHHLARIDEVIRS